MRASGAAAGSHQLVNGRTRNSVTTGGRAERGVVKYFCTFQNTVADVLAARGWEEVDDDNTWDFVWADRDWIYTAFDKMHLDQWQRLNHFRNGRELCRKDLMAKNLKRRRRTLEKEGKLEEAQSYDFIPTTFVLPREYSMFVEEFKKTGGVWIMKVGHPVRGRSHHSFPRSLTHPLLVPATRHHRAPLTTADRIGAGQGYLPVHQTERNQRVENRFQIVQTSRSEGERRQGSRSIRGAAVSAVSAADWREEVRHAVVLFGDFLQPHEGVSVSKGLRALHELQVLVRRAGHLQRIRAPDERGHPEDRGELRRAHGRQDGAAGDEVVPDEQAQR
jgi:hypothetical protein